MVGISSEEARYLRAKGRQEDIHMSSRDKKSRHKRYYATESYRTMQLLNKYRNKEIVETYDGR